ncbi:MAG: DNA polymerase III subunit gamma/tau [Fimbriimonadales bacterium]
MAYISLYRKYRAQGFDELMGQEHVTVTLRNAIQQGKWSHAYLFCGPRGTGKTSTARLLAKALNCEQGPTPNPCTTCRFCVSIQQGACVDVIEMDAASETSIEDVRSSIIENAKYPPMEARYKVYIIDEVHDLSAKAFDALLKTIEEPPPHVVFVLATTEFHRVPPTIRSRCQRFDFHRGTIADITRRLEYVVQAEGLQADPNALNLVARYADGSWRDALTALEQVIAFSEDGVLRTETVYNALGVLEDETLMRLTDALIEGDSSTVLTILDQQLLLGREPRIFAESLIQHWRALIQAVLHGSDRGGYYDPTQWSAMIEQGRRAGVPRLLGWWEKLAGALSEMRSSGSPRAILELYLLIFASGTPITPQTASPRPAPSASTPTPTPNAQAGGTPQPMPAPTTSSAPAGTSQPMPDTPPTASPVQPNEVNLIWQRKVQEVKQISPAGGRNLEGSRVAIQGDTVVLYLRSELALGFFTATPKRETNLKELVRSAVGMPGAKVTLQVDATQPTMPLDEPSESASPVLDGEALVEAVIRDFNGHEVEES